MPKSVGYLYRKRDSINWWIKLQYPASMCRPMVRKSLGTPDRTEAEIMALPMIQQHKRELYLVRQNVTRKLHVGSVMNRYPLGDSTLEDGTKVFATQTTAVLIRDGVLVAQEDNFLLDLTDVTRTFDPQEANEAKPKRPIDNDLQMLETYLGLKNRNKYYEKEARNTWDLFKKLTGGKLIRNCTRDDARILVGHLQTKARPDKNATIVKKLNYLAAPVNYAIKEGLLTFNPFASVAPQGNDAARRFPFTDAEMTLVCSTLGDMDPEVRRLWVLLATTGMRLGEAFQITKEEAEKGIRKVLIGSKTEQSLRWIPIPDQALMVLPDRITGPLFTSNAKNLGRVLLRVIRKLGINDEGKVLHSLRHRAKDRLRADGCPLHLQYELLGHEERTVAAGYGHGSPMTVLKPWIDKIGLI